MAFSPPVAVVGSHAALRTLGNSQYQTAIVKATTAAPDGGGAIYAYAASDLSGAYFEGYTTSGSTTLTVLSTINGSLEIGQTVNRADTGVSIGVIVAGGGTSWTLSVTAPTYSGYLTADTDSNYIVDLVGGRWFNLGLYPRTTAEIAARVVPVNYTAPPGAFSRYGISPTNTDNGPALNQALSCNAIVYDDLEGYAVPPGVTEAASPAIPANVQSNVYSIKTTVMMQAVGQILRGRGFGDQNASPPRLSPRTTLKWNGVQGGTVLQTWYTQGTYTSPYPVNPSEGQIQDLLIDGNSGTNSAAYGINGYASVPPPGDGVYRWTFRNVGVINVTGSTRPITFSAPPVGSSGGTLSVSSPWTGAYGIYLVTIPGVDNPIPMLFNPFGTGLAVDWAVDITGATSAACMVGLATGLFLGGGTTNDNNNDSRWENCFFENCTIGIQSGGATEGGKSTSFLNCGIGFNGTFGVDFTTLECRFTGNYLDIGLCNANWADAGSTFKGSMYGVLNSYIACSLCMSGSSLSTAYPGSLIDLVGSSGNAAFPGCFIPSSSASTLIRGLNVGYYYDFSTLDCTVSYAESAAFSGNAAGLSNISQAKFMAAPLATTGGVTGSGQTYAVMKEPTSPPTSPSSVVYDLSGSLDFNGVFTAPLSGYYRFVAKVALTGITTAHNNCQLSITISGTPATVYQLARLNPGAAIIGGTSEVDVNGEIVAHMLAGATATLSIYVAGGPSPPTVAVLFGDVYVYSPPGHKTEHIYRTYLFGQLT